VQAASVQVDATPPPSRLSIGGPQLLVNGMLFCQRADAVFLWPLKTPISQGVASGVKTSWMSVNLGPFSVVSGTFTLSKPS